MIKKYDYIKDGELDEQKLIEDLAPIMISMQYAEEKILEVFRKSDNEENFEVIIEYYTKRKELVNEYIQKLNESKW